MPLVFASLLPPSPFSPSPFAFARPLVDSQLLLILKYRRPNTAHMRCATTPAPMPLPFCTPRSCVVRACRRPLPRAHFRYARKSRPLLLRVRTLLTPCGPQVCMHARTRARAHTHTHRHTDSLTWLGSTHRRQLLRNPLLRDREAGRGVRPSG